MQYVFSKYFIGDKQLILFSEKVKLFVYKGQIICFRHVFLTMVTFTVDYTLTTLTNVGLPEKFSILFIVLYHNKQFEIDDSFICL